MTALWWAVIVSGVYHGLNPGMGWPLAVSAALMEQRRTAMPKALAMLAAGHFLAMIGILLPFSLIVGLVERQAEIRIGAGVLVIAMGVYLLVNRRHPRMLARVKPTRLVLWSFLAAMAHGAGTMLVPIYLGIAATGSPHSVYQAAGAMVQGGIISAFAVSAVHTVAMSLAAAAVAAVIYYWLGLKFLSKTWFNLDLLWALSLIVVGAFGVRSAYTGH